MDKSVWYRVRLCAGPFTKVALLVCMLFLPGCGGSSSEESSRAVRYPSQKPAAAHSDVGVGDLYAVVVGVSKYRNSEIPTLRFADKDAKDFASFLETQKQLYHEIHIKRLINEEATQQEVKKQLFYDLRRAGKDDTVILFFAGHGGDDPTMPGEFFFLTHDADPKFPEATAINMSKSGFMSRIDSKRVVMIADTCRSGGILAGTDGSRSVQPSLERFMAQIKESEGKVVLSASRADEAAKEKTELGNGVFTHYLLKGLKGDADADRDGVVTLQEIYDYVYDKTRQATGGVQRPQMAAGRIVGRFPMSLVRGPETQSVASLPQNAPPRTPTTSPREQPDELTRLRTLAEGGNVQAQFELGIKYEYGLGVSKDKAEALKWHFKASEQGNQEARLALARLSPSPSVAPSPPSPPASASQRPSEDTPTRWDVKWLVIKNKNGKCWVIDSINDKTEHSIGGPFQTKAEAEKAREKLCRKPATPSPAATQRPSQPIRRDPSKDEPLIRAARDGNTKQVEELLSQGADVNAKDYQRMTALYSAAWNGKKETVRLLLDRGADINAKDMSGWTALHCAAKASDGETVCLLLDRGANIDAKDGSGRTALHLAVLWGHKETVQFLLDRGANIDAKDHFGRTALDTARREGKKEIAAILSEYRRNEMRKELLAPGAGGPTDFPLLDGGGLPRS